MRWTEEPAGEKGVRGGLVAVIGQVNCSVQLNVDGGEVLAINGFLDAAAVKPKFPSNLPDFADHAASPLCTGGPASKSFVIRMLNLRPMRGDESIEDKVSAESKLVGNEAKMRDGIGKRGPPWEITAAGIEERNHSKF